MTHWDVHVVAAEHLEEVDNLSSRRPEVHLGKAGVVAETDSLSGGLKPQI